MTQATSMVRFEMMAESPSPPELPAHGDTRDVEKMNDGVRRLSEALRRAQDSSITISNGQAWKKYTVEQSWIRVRQPAAEKRRQVDSGNATDGGTDRFSICRRIPVPGSRVPAMFSIRSIINLKLLEERRRSDEWAATFTIGITLSFHCRSLRWHADRLSHIQINY